MSDTPKPITRKQAEAALAAVKEQFKNYIAAGYREPELREPGTESSHWAIAWDEGPFEWTYRAFEGGVDEELYYLAKDAGADKERARSIATDAGITAPKGVFPEPINSWCLGLYPDW